MPSALPIVYRVAFGLSQNQTGQGIGRIRRDPGGDVEGVVAHSSLSHGCPDRGPSPTTSSFDRFARRTRFSTRRVSCGRLKTNMATGVCIPVSLFQRTSGRSLSLQSRLGLRKIEVRKIEVDRNFDRIVAFAEVERFIDSSVEFRSMRARRCCSSVTIHAEG